MKQFLLLVAYLLLLFNGVGAIYGGSSLVLLPDGSGLKMSLHWLQHTPFTNYLVPGIILLVCNGLFSFLTIYITFTRRTAYPLYIIAQGALLTGWIVIQILLIRTVVELHIITGSTGILLLLCGLVLRQMEHRATTHKTARA